VSSGFFLGHVETPTNLTKYSGFNSLLNIFVLFQQSNILAGFLPINQEAEMENMFNLEGKVAIVTGGNGGIGKGIARGFAAMGADITIAARNLQKTAEAEREIKEAFSVQVLGLKVDVADEEHVKAMVAQTLEKFGRIDILVNNAGINIRKMPQDYQVSEWDEVIDANLRSAFLCSQAVYPAMKKAGGGKIINIGSMTSIFGGAKLAPYGTSKGGIVQLARSLAAAWAPDNIQVNAILPGWIDTDLTKQARKDLAGLDESVKSRTPVKRWGDPQDLAGTAVFLASRASDFVTGVALPVDGGFSIALM
jgi:2-deoxy-D-gluconate 3-dehydrogenase